MGYNVWTTESTARIPVANLQRAYEKMCTLNVTHHDQKRGGSYSNGVKTTAYFSWMDVDYPETCKDAQEILSMLGFDTSYNQYGDLLIEAYDNKTGQEALFLETINTDVIGKIKWVGEDGLKWTTKFAGKLVINEC